MRNTYCDLFLFGKSFFVFIFISRSFKDMDFMICYIIENLKKVIMWRVTS